MATIIFGFGQLFDPANIFISQVFFGINITAILITVIKYLTFLVGWLLIPGHILGNVHIHALGHLAAGVFGLLQSYGGMKEHIKTSGNILVLHVPNHISALNI